MLGPVLFPEPVLTATTPPPNPPNQPPPPRQARGRHIDIPPRGVTAFVPNEILLEVESGTPAQYLNVVSRQLRLTLLETQSFTLTGRTLQRWRIDGNASVRATLRGLSPFSRISTAQPNFLYRFGQAQPPGQSDAGAQYVIPKLHLTEAHKITNGDDVLVAVINSKIDASHPDLAGAIADQFDALGTAGPAHMHGTGMAGAIASHTKLVGVAPKVKLLAVRAFSGDKDGAQGTTFNILKGLDWAASKQARIVNMSFAGPADSMLRDMLAQGACARHGADRRGRQCGAALATAFSGGRSRRHRRDRDRRRGQVVAAGQSRPASGGGGARRAWCSSRRPMEDTRSPPAPRSPPRMRPASPHCCLRAIRSSRQIRCAAC